MSARTVKTKSATKSMTKSFEPEIIIFSCEWNPNICADNAGADRKPYPPNVKIVKVNCTGRITTAFLLRAFKEGAHGVLVSACGIGECHYISGNEECRKRVEEALSLLASSGIDRKRLAMEYFSDVHGSAFASVMERFVTKIRNLGPMTMEVAA
jgi:F420-non-reducing hydrogenase iron-sulfur subunit